MLLKPETPIRRRIAAGNATQSAHCSGVAIGARRWQAVVAASANAIELDCWLSDVGIKHYRRRVTCAPSLKALGGADALRRIALIMMAWPSLASVPSISAARRRRDGGIKRQKRASRWLGDGGRRPRRESVACASSISISL